MRQLYQRTPTNKQQQAELDNEMVQLGIVDAPMDNENIVFWQEHEIAITWWLQVQDLMRYNGPVCEGLDVIALQADSQMSGREIDAMDYQKLRLIAQTVTGLLNDRLPQG